jgi:hypothetical protein
VKKALCGQNPHGDARECGAPIKCIQPIHLSLDDVWVSRRTSFSQSRARGRAIPGPQMRGTRGHPQIVGEQNKMAAKSGGERIEYELE